MKPTVEINTEEFHRVMRLWMLKSSQELSKAVNRRMFFLLVRLYVLTPPKNPQAQRDKIRSYLGHEIGERRFSAKTGKKVGKQRALKRVHLIIQARLAKAGKAGLYGAKMKEATKTFLKRSIGSVGYLKAPVVRAIKGFSGHFSQWGGTTKKARGANYNPNSALVRIGAEYGVFASSGNVAMFKGAKAQNKPARPGLKPTAESSMSVSTREDTGKIDSIYRDAVSKAFADETAEMRAHIEDVMNETAEQAVQETANGRAG